jgi:parvulin-like peptidyl-prolyl isomerase
MLKTITVTPQEIIHQLKISCLIPEIISGIISRKIITEKAQELSIKPTSIDLQQAADNIRLEGHLISAEDTFEWLKANHLSADDFEEIVLTSLFSNEVANQLFAKQVESYFFDHQLDYMAVILYEIILEDQDLAMELFYAIQEQEISFHDAAHKYISDPELRRQGGYRGVLRRKDLRPEILSAVFGAKPPEIIKPIVTSVGVHLIFVEEIIKQQLDDQLGQQICLDLFNKWINEEASSWEVITEIQTSEPMLAK